MSTGKTIALTRQTSVGKVISLLFHMLSRLVITFLPRMKCSYPHTKISKWKWKSLVSDSLQTHGLYSPWNSPGQNTGMGSLSLLQGIFPTQGLNPGLPHCRRILYQLSHKGSPRILEWVAYPFSRRSSQPRNRTVVSFIAGFFTNWAIREALYCLKGVCMNIN